MQPHPLSISLGMLTKGEAVIGFEVSWLIPKGVSLETPLDPPLGWAEGVPDSIVMVGSWLA